jgi:hypothetical protein
MIRQSESKQAESLQLEDRDTIQSPHVDFIEVDPEIMPSAELIQEDVAIQKRQKPKRSLLLWSIYSLLGFGLLAISAPIFLSQIYGCGVIKVRSFEGRTYVGNMNKIQQSLWLDNGAFGKSISDLSEIGIKEVTDSYKYEIQSFQLVSYQYAISQNDKAKSFVGAVFVLPENPQVFQGLNQQVEYPKDSTKAVKKDLITFAILCESPEGVKIKLSKPFLDNGKPTCPEGTINSYIN